MLFVNSSAQRAVPALARVAEEHCPAKQRCAAPRRATQVCAYGQEEAESLNYCTAEGGPGEPSNDLEVKPPPQAPSQLCQGPVLHSGPS